MSQVRIVSALDRQRLYDAAPFTVPMADYVSEIHRLLAFATPVPPEHVPPNLVSMNSSVRIRDMDTGECDTYDLVYPFDANNRPLGRSVTAPCGAAMFCRYVGEHIMWRTPSAVRRAVIDALEYQPEREGHFDR